MNIIDDWKKLSINGKVTCTLREHKIYNSFQNICSHDRNVIPDKTLIPVKNIIDGKTIGVEPLYPPLDCKFSPFEESNYICYCVGEEGSLLCLNTQKQSVKMVESNCRISERRSPLYNIDWSKKTNKLVLAAWMQEVCLIDAWSMKKSFSIPVLEPVRCAIFDAYDPNVVHVGGKKNYVSFLDIRTEKMLNPLFDLKNGCVELKNQDNLTVQTITSIKDHKIAICFDRLSTIFIYDTRYFKRNSIKKNSLVSPHSVIGYYGKHQSSGFTHMVSTNSLMFASCTDNRIYQYEINLAILNAYNIGNFVKDTCAQKFPKLKTKPQFPKLQPFFKINKGSPLAKSSLDNRNPFSSKFASYDTAGSTKFQPLSNITKFNTCPTILPNSNNSLRFPCCIYTHGHQNIKYRVKLDVCYDRQILSCGSVFNCVILWKIDSPKIPLLILDSKSNSDNLIQDCISYGGVFNKFTNTILTRGFEAVRLWKKNMDLLSGDSDESIKTPLYCYNQSSNNFATNKFESSEDCEIMAYMKLPKELQNLIAFFPFSEGILKEINDEKPVDCLGEPIRDAMSIADLADIFDNKEDILTTFAYRIKLKRIDISNIEDFKFIYICYISGTTYRYLTKRMFIETLIELNLDTASVKVFNNTMFLIPDLSKNKNSQYITNHGIMLNLKQIISRKRLNLSSSSITGEDQFNLLDNEAVFFKHDNSGNLFSFTFKLFYYDKKLGKALD